MSGSGRNLAADCMHMHTANALVLQGMGAGADGEIHEGAPFVLLSIVTLPFPTSDNNLNNYRWMMLACT